MRAVSVQGVIVMQVVLLGLPACKSAPPTGVPGAEADTLARRMQASVHHDAWERTAAVEWVFAGKNRHLWDRRRGFALVEWDEHRALVAIDARKGIAFSDGRSLSEEEASEKLDEAHAKWTNDAFWLNPVVKAFDPGTVRERVPARDGRPGLLVRYVSGGRTPGDVYLWWLESEASARPVAWQMWTSNIPIGGVEASWEGWVELDTGAMVATRHETALFDLELTEVAGAEALERLRKGPDPFAPLAGCLAASSCVDF